VNSVLIGAKNSNSNMLIVIWKYLSSSWKLELKVDLDINTISTYDILIEYYDFLKLHLIKLQIYKLEKHLKLLLKAEHYNSYFLIRGGFNFV
jgi:hypothetical protein